MIEEDRVNAHAQMGIVHFKKDVLKLDRSPIPAAKSEVSSPTPKVSSKTGREVLYFNSTQDALHGVSEVEHPANPVNPMPASQNVPRFSSKTGREILTLDRYSSEKDEKKPAFSGAITLESSESEDLEAAPPDFEEGAHNFI